MKIKKKLLGIIAIVGIILLAGKVNFIGGLSNDRESYINDRTKENDKYLMLVNKENPLGLDFKPDNLVKPNVRFLSNTEEESKHMDEEAAKALEKLFLEAKEEDITFIGSSAYRSYKSQVRVLNDEIRKKGVDYANNYVAKPGKSEHQSGLAIDVTNEARCMNKASKEAQWLANNAHRFGFILRYPEGKEGITGYSYEPWHIRYVGKDVAKEIYSKGMTLEEHLDKINK